MAVEFRRIVVETAVENTVYAKPLTETSELRTEHFIVGKNVVAFGYRQSVAGSDKYGICLTQRVTGLFDKFFHGQYILLGLKIVLCSSRFKPSVGLPNKDFNAKAISSFTARLLPAISFGMMACCGLIGT